LENLQLKVHVLANLFANIPKNQLVKLSYHFEEKNYPKNSYIFKEGEEAEKVYLLKRGQVHLLKEIPLAGMQTTVAEVKSPTTQNHTIHTKSASLMDDPLAAQLFLGRGVSGGEGL
jgi:CRP-like cAMP-binding protein